MEGAVQRVRPKVMTVTAVMGGLLPIMWTTGTDANMMKRIVAPMIGGMASSTTLTLIVIPILYSMWRRVQLRSVIPVLYRRECCGQETMNKNTYKCVSRECEEIQKDSTSRSCSSAFSAVSSRDCASTAIPWMRPHRDKSQTVLSKDTWSSPPFVHAILQPVPWYWVKGPQLFVEALDSIPECKV